jgi:hypothetical protein
MDEFQIAGDFHFFVGSNQPFQPSMLPPRAKYLIVTGDIIQPYTKEAFSFYTHCAKNWEKTFIVMGNQEYEASAHLFPFSMEYHEAYMRHMINIVDKEKLVLLQRDFVDLPGLRVAGLTLWVDGTNLMNLRKTVNVPRNYVLTEGETCTFTTNLNLRFTPPYTRSTNEFSFHEHGHPGVNPFNETTSDLRISQEDLQEMQKKDTEFVERMMECKTPLLMISHYIPTLDVIPESPVVSSYVDPFPFTEYCRDMSQYLKPPICAWVCGHIHHEQVSGIVHINCSRIYSPPNFL